MKRLEKKKAIIIGGTSGLGLAIAEAYVSEGAAVVPLSRSLSKVKKTISNLRKKGNLNDICLTLDVANEKDVQKKVQQLKKELGSWDVLVCTAGTHLKKDFLKMTSKQWHHVMDVNLHGSFYANRYFGEVMCKRKKGSIINVSSLGAEQALSGAAAYCVSKSAVRMLTKSLAVEWAPYKVRVNALLPGVFPTPLNQKALSDKTRVKKIISKTPLSRMGKPEEIAGAAVYLASDESQFVTGTELIVDGGFLASSGF